MSVTTVLPTSRAIRQHLLYHRDRNGFLPRYMTMGELMNRAVVADGFFKVDRDTRTLALLEAADFSAFGHLQIERNFFTFTRNSAYLFRFFEELAGELVDIDALDAADTYGDFSEHIEILSTLRRRYRDICMQRKILDPVFLPEIYTLNSGWIRTLDGLKIEAEGYLTNFELKILAEIAGIVPVQLQFESHRFNTKMQEKFAAMGIEVPQGRRYTIDLASKTLIESEPIVRRPEVECTPLSERMLQAAFVKQQVYEMVRGGIDPERIAVVLPDEGFAPMLRRFDTEGNFNFAMGEPLAHSRFVTVCEALMAYAENPGAENTMRLQREYGKEPLWFVSAYSAAADWETFVTAVRTLLEEESSETVRGIVEEVLFHFEKLLPAVGRATLRTLMHLFVNRLKEERLDDVRGGKVTVMGVLETRACTFDGVVIVDFNEAYVPHKSDKDLFINSAVRERAGLPGTHERQALQKLFYHQLISRAQKVAVSFVESETVLPSRFMKELKLPVQRRYGDDAWAQILYEKQASRLREVPEIECEYDFGARPLSATALKTFLECRRQFYHRYVEGVREHRLPREMPEEYEMGNALHDALRDVYREHDRFTEAAELKAAVAQALAYHSGESELERFLQQLWLKRLEPFFEHEIGRFREVRVAACEKKLSMPYAGLRIEGQIDRIDTGPQGLQVLDYKSGKYPLYTEKTLEKATDFQLEFYYLLASQTGEVDFCGYYDLNKGEIVKEQVMEQKLQRLDEHLQALRQTKRFVFERTDELQRCRYCPYAALCAREEA